MKAIIVKLSENRTLVEKRFDAMVRSSEIGGHKIISSKKFFFEVVLNYFEEKPRVASKCLKCNLELVMHLNKAICKAEYACAKPQRTMNMALYQ